MKRFLIGVSASAPHLKHLEDDGLSIVEKQSLPEKNDSTSKSWLLEPSRCLAGRHVPSVLLVLLELRSL